MLNSPICIADNKTVEDATHELSCTHSFNGKSKTHYKMPCIILKEMSNNRYKILVFGERYWKNKGHISRVRYVDKSKVTGMKK